MHWLWLWPLSGLIVWGWFNYSRDVSYKENGLKITIRASTKVMDLLVSLLAGPIILAATIVVFFLDDNDTRDKSRKIYPKFGFKIW